MTPFEKRKTLPRIVPAVTISFPIFVVLLAMIIAVEMTLQVLNLVPDSAGNWLLIGTLASALLFILATPLSVLLDKPDVSNKVGSDHVV